MHSDELAEGFFSEPWALNQFFEDFYKKNEPIVDQIENWSNNNSFNLNEGWKVELARNIQNRFEKLFDNIPDKKVNQWEKLFHKFLEKH